MILLADDVISCVMVQGTAASTKNKLPALITSMETIGAKALEEFADSIKVSTDQRSASVTSEWPVSRQNVFMYCGYS